MSITRQLASVAGAAALVLLAGRPAFAGGASYDANKLRDGAFLRDWLVCGPFPNPLRNGAKEYFHNDDCIGYFTDYLAPVGGEAGARPKAGQVVAPQGVEKRTWRLYESPRDAIEFDEIMKPSDGMVGYAACTIRSDRAENRLFGLGSNDGVRVWLNGREVWRFHGPRSIELDDDYLRLPLRKGDNRLLVKVDNGLGRWGFQLRPMTDAMARAFLLQHVENRLELRFAYANGAMHGRFGIARRTAAVHGLPAAKLVVRTIAGKAVRTMQMALGRDYVFRGPQFPEREYLVEAVLPVPGGPAYRLPSYFTTYDVAGTVRTLLAADFPKPQPSRRSQAINGLIEHLQWLANVGRASDDPYAYRRIEIGLGRLRDQLTQLASKSATPYDGLFPTPRKVELRAPATCAIDDTWNVSAPGSVIAVGPLIPFFDTWHRRLGQPPNQVDTAGPGVVAVRVAGDPASADVPKDLLARLPSNDEAFVLDVQPDRVTILGRSRAAALYGVDAFGQLLEQKGPIPCGTVIDQPAYPLRSVCEVVNCESTDFLRDIAQYSRLRYNQVMVYGDYEHLDDPKVAAKLRQVFDYCRARCVEPIPSIETFGGGSIALAVDPDIAEGVYHPRVPYVVGKDGSVHITGPRILDTVTARPAVEDAAGRTLKRGVDYDVVSKEPPVIRFMGTAAKPGARVRVSYDLVDFASFRFSATCPSDPRRWPYIDKVIGDIFRVLKPVAIHLGQDEGGFMDRDSRCLARHMTARQLMADQFKRTYDIVHKYDPHATVQLWGDEFNPYMNAPFLGGPDSVRDLPKDVIVMDWAYGGQNHSVLRGLERNAGVFAKLGIRVAGASYDDPLNTVHLAHMGPVLGDKYVGLVHTFWGGYAGGREITAQGAWQGTTMLGDFSF